MNRISEFSDELLVKILLFLPTKVVVSTSILSKRWEFLWMWLPKLNYKGEHLPANERKRLHRFLVRNLPVHRAPVIESLSLHFCSANLEPKDIKIWVITAVSRIIRELDLLYGLPLGQVQKISPSNLFTCKSLVNLKLTGKMLLDVPRMVSLPCLKALDLRFVTYLNEDCLERLLSNCPVLEYLLVHINGSENMKKLIIRASLQRLSLFIHSSLELRNIFPSSLELRNIFPSHLYSSKSLVTLNLEATILLDVPCMVCLPSLKTLRLRRVTYLNEGCLQRLLSKCPVREDLLVDHRFEDGNMKKFVVIVPSLHRLSLYIPLHVFELVINTPSLTYLKLVLHNSKSHYFSIENMPRLREAYVNVHFLDLRSLIRSITFVKHLEFCLTADSSEAVYGDGFVFNKLKRLKLCSCPQYLSNVLVWLLKDSPKLRVLGFNRMDGSFSEKLMNLSSNAEFGFNLLVLNLISGSRE